MAAKRVIICHACEHRTRGIGRVFCQVESAPVEIASRIKRGCPAKKFPPCDRCGGMEHDTSGCPIPAELTPEIARYNAKNNVGGCGC